MGRELPKSELSKQFGTGFSGAVSELIAAADLMRRGFYVFRSLSPACTCDLVIMQGEIGARVEVRTGRILSCGKLIFPFGLKDKGKQDFFAVVVQEKVFYVQVTTKSETTTKNKTITVLDLAEFWRGWTGKAI